MHHLLAHSDPSIQVLVPSVFIFKKVMLPLTTSIPKEVPEVTMQITETSNIVANNFDLHQGRVVNEFKKPISRIWFAGGFVCPR